MPQKLTPMSQLVKKIDFHMRQNFQGVVLWTLTTKMEPNGNPTTTFTPSLPSSCTVDDLRLKKESSNNSPKKVNMQTSNKVGIP
jgi:hypothetical protein